MLPVLQPPAPPGCLNNRLQRCYLLLFASMGRGSGCLGALIFCVCPDAYPQGGEEAARRALALIPESVVSDLAAYLNYLIQRGATDLLGGMDIGALMACITGLLARPDLMPSAVVRQSLVQLLAGMLAPGRAREDDGGRGGRGSLGPSRLSAAQMALLAAALGAGSTQAELLPALMATYTHADHVVGLDVDKNSYNKFYLRGLVESVLLEVWRDPACAASLARLAEAEELRAEAEAAAGGGEAPAAGGGIGSGSGPEPTTAAGASFPDFIGAALLALNFTLQTGLEFLVEIRGLEAGMADRAAWAALPPGEALRKLAYLEGVKAPAKSMLWSADSTLHMLRTLAEHSAVQRGFMREPVATRAATAVSDFCGGPPPLVAHPLHCPLPALL